MSEFRPQLILVLILATLSARAQAPTGTISGLVDDSSGKPVAGARLRLTNRDSGLVRSLTTSSEGDYSVAALPPGVYLVTIEADGFESLAHTALVETGRTTTLTFALQVREMSETVMVNTSVPLMQYEHHQVGGLVGAEPDRGPAA